MNKQSIKNSDINKYLRKLQKELSVIYSKDETAQILQMIRSGMEDYMTEHPSCTLEELKNYLQTEEVFADWIRNTDAAKVKKTLDTHMIQNKAVGVIITAAIAIVIFFNLHSFFMTYNHDIGRQHETIINSVR